MYVEVDSNFFYSFILCSIWVPILIHFDFNLRVDPPRPLTITRIICYKFFSFFYDIRALLSSFLAVLNEFLIAKISSSETMKTLKLTSKNVEFLLIISQKLMGSRTLLSKLMGSMEPMLTTALVLVHSGGGLVVRGPSFSCSRICQNSENQF